MAPMVADLMAAEMGWNADSMERELKRFRDAAKNYVLSK
jgi:hypothetical protein